MNRENSRKYPRSVESKNSFLRIRAPENLDIALEGLIRKVLKEQPKMDDIYAFAADYFDMLLKIREKSGIKKLSAQDICPCHNEDDAHEMIKLASSFAKRTKPHSNTYKALTLRNPDESKYRKSSRKKESQGLEAVSKENEGSDRIADILQVVKENTESEKTKNEPNESESESVENETGYSAKVSAQDVGEEVFIKANEIVTEYNAEDEDSPRDVLGNVTESVADINELRDKIKAVENEIKLLDNKEKKTENEIAGENAAGEGSGINESENLDENLEESKLGRSVEDIEEAGTSLGEESEVKENSMKASTQEPEDVKMYVVTENVQESGDANVNAENIDELDEKSEEQGDVKINAEYEGSQQLDIETETKYEGSETQDVNTDAVEKVEETKSDAETVREETETEVENVKSNGVEAEKDKEAGPDKETENEDAQEGNPTEKLEPDEALQDKEKEFMGDENPKDENVESEKFVEEEREAMEVQNSDAVKSDVIEKDDVTLTDDNSEVHEVDAAVSDKRDEDNAKLDEAEQVEKEVVISAGSDINVPDSVAPVILGSTLDGTEKIVEAPVEESPSAEEILLRDGPEAPDISTAAEIEKFLDSEREYSSNEKEAEEQEPTAANDGNSVESKITSRAVSQLGTISENEELLTPGDDTSGKVPGTTQKPDDLDPDNHEGSTTSDEIEFEISPAKYPETDTPIIAEITNAENDEMQKETHAEPKIILELDTEDQKSEDQAEELGKEPNKALLEVPELILGENVVGKPEDKTAETESAVEKPEDAGIPECGNIGNEIIQKGEVEKVELVEGEEDILQVHLTTTIETEEDERESVHVEMTSTIDPDFRVSVETKIESPAQDPGNMENMKLIRAAIIIQNGFRRLKKKKISKEDNKQLNNEDVPDSKENESTASHHHTMADPCGDSNPSLEEENKKTLNLGEARTLVETQSLDSMRKISPLKTRSLSSVRHGVGDFEVWNQLVKELEAAATKIQSNYRGYKSRKRLKRENAVQSTTTTSEDSASMPDLEINHRHTGEFHDSVVLPLDPK